MMLRALLLVSTAVCASAQTTRLVDITPTPVFQSTSRSLPTPLAPGEPVDSDVQVPEFLSCASDSDCMVRDVGNCCHFFPMCANAAVELPLPCPEDQFGVCGFYTVDSCRCGSLGGCMSYQGDVLIHGAAFDEAPSALSVEE
jgi:hypothetical protein